MRLTLILAGLAIAATSLPAQQPRQPMMRGGGGMAAWIASNPAELNLTPDQARRVRERADALERTNAPLRSQVDSLWAGRDLRAMTWPDRHALNVATRAVRQTMADNTASAVSDMRSLLTPEQQAVMDRHVPGVGAGRAGAMGRGQGPMRGGRMGMRGGRGTMGSGRQMGHRHCPGC